MAKKKKKQETEELKAEELAEIEVQVEALGETDTADEQEPESAEEQWQRELEASRAEALNNHELYLRAMADMENLRKRSQREKEDIAKFSNETILREILPVFDNLERAVEHAVEDQSTNGLLEGVQMTLDQFGTVLEKFNVVAVEAIGQTFDPAVHQAMGQVETEDYPPNTVAQEMQRGYLLNERLLRPSLVMISTAPVAAAETDSQGTNDSE